jgi:hypothetical protein
MTHAGSRMQPTSIDLWHGTTILTVRKAGYRLSI